MFYGLVRRQDLKRGEMMPSLGKIWACSRRESCDHAGYGSSSREAAQPRAEGLQHRQGLQQEMGSNQSSPRRDRKTPRKQKRLGRVWWHL